MSDYIAWYLIELRTRLAPHMPSTRVETVVKEAESHLREATESLKNQLCLSEESATLAAIDAFGKPERVALTYLRENNSRILGMKPVFLVVGGALISLFCWVFHWLSLGGPFDNYGETWQNGLAGVIGSVALVGFALGCRAGRKSYWRQILGVGGVFLASAILFVSCWVVPVGEGFDGALRSNFDRIEKETPGSIAKLDRYAAFLKKGAKEFAAARAPSDLSREYADISIAERELGIDVGRSLRPTISTPEGEQNVVASFVTPTHNIFAMPGRETYLGLEGRPTFSESKAAWSSMAAGALDVTRYERAKTLELLRRIHEARSGRVFSFNPFLLISLVSMTVTFLPGLLLLDWVTLSALRRKRAWPVRGLA